MTDPDTPQNDYDARANPNHVPGERHLDHVGPPVADTTEWLRPPTTADEVTTSITAEDDA